MRCRWILLEEIGGGGFATVYRATCRDCGGEAAVKKLTNWWDPDARHRFAREVRTLRAIRHANIIPIIDADPDAREPWYAMPLMHGGTLAQHCGRLRDDVARMVMGALAETIAYLHREGAIHRDIKPDNILINETGELRLADFGLGNDPRYTVAFTVHAMGTPAYAAPEVFEGRTTSFEADVYSLGATFFHLLTGQPPGKLRDPRVLRQATPANIAALIMGMLDPVATRRPTMDRVIAVLAGRVAAPVATTPPAVTPPNQKADVDWGAVAGVAGLFLLVAGIAAACSSD